MRVPRLDTSHTGGDHAAAMHGEVQKIFDQHHEAMGAAQSSDDRFKSIAHTYRRLESLHPFHDGTSRTNHLLLNKMLTEAGHYPVTLHSPSAPTTSLDDLTRHIGRKSS